MCSWNTEVWRGGEGVINFPNIDMCFDDSSWAQERGKMFSEACHWMKSFGKDLPFSLFFPPQMHWLNMLTLGHYIEE